MFVGLPSAGLFTSSIFALTLGCLEDDSFGADAEDAVSALPELLRCVVQAVDALPAEVLPQFVGKNPVHTPAHTMS